MAAVYLRRLHGWRFVLFNAVLGLSHIVVLFNCGSYIALLPHVSGDLGGVLPSFLTWAQTDFMVGLALGFPLARYLSGRIGDYRLLIGAFMVYSVASYLCGDNRTLAQFVPARIVQGIAGGITLPIAQSMLLMHLSQFSQGLDGIQTPLSPIRTTTTIAPTSIFRQILASA